MVENAQAQDEVLTVDMTPTLYSLATFIDTFDNLPAYRIRLKFCALCDSVFSRPDMLRKDSTSSHRQKILDILLGWIHDPTMVRVRGDQLDGMHSRQFIFRPMIQTPPAFFPN
jgi:hypothetical protein